MAPSITLPVCSEPGLDYATDGLGQTGASHSVADSLVILQSLRQSRDTWLSSMFPKFSTKSKAKQATELLPQPAPHNLKQIGKCDVEIGPHIFPETTFFEVHYVSHSTPYSAKAGSYYYPSFASTGQWSTKMPYSSTQYQPNLFQPPAPTVPTVTQPPASAPLINSLESSVEVTPALITQVNNAAASNPTLQNLLQIAASGRATTDQLKTLGILIQSLAAQPATQPPVLDTAKSITSTNSTAAPSNLPSYGDTPPPPTGTPVYSNYKPYTSNYPYPQPSTSNYQTTIMAKKSEIILEFRENSSDRWLLPNDSLTCERVGPSEAFESDVVISAFISPKGSKTEGSSFPLRLRLTKVTPSFWTAISTWAGDKALSSESREIFMKRVADCPPRSYLFYQIPDSPILTQLQNAASPYLMKSIKPGQSSEVNKPKRQQRPRKSAANAAVVATPTGGQTTVSPSATETKPTPPKRRKVTQVKPTFKISCVTCGITDVPLLMGGRYCRPCLEASNNANDGYTFVPKPAITVTGSPSSGHTSAPYTHTPSNPSIVFTTPLDATTIAARSEASSQNSEGK
ncbi:hypothetical protein BD410DRAFT_824948 [Rickenella mellea]|uniref:SWR1-complex protein 3 domain-containing protein n=1 Tax=Rickenella mellea TaxID=50990 RepID=A0A4Y7QKU0_9AGAM|nr:hypothetical protein BD410DRAFT_824948 [Rickenella mellea]